MSELQCAFGGGGPAAQQVLKVMWRRSPALMVRSCSARTSVIHGWAGSPPPPCPGTALRKNCPLVPRSNSRTTFFHHGIGFFMVLVDAGQLFRCAGQDNIVLLWVPPSWGDPISQSQAHIPLKPLPPALDPFREATSP